MKYALDLEDCKVINDNAVVYGTVFNNARIYGNARIENSAEVSDEVKNIMMLKLVKMQ